MDFRHLIVTCLFSKLRLPFDNQKVKENYAIFLCKFHDFNQKTRSITQSHELTTLAEILPLAKGLLKDIEYTTHPIRLIGLSVSNPYEKNEEKARWEQLSFEFSDWDYSK